MEGHQEVEGMTPGRTPDGIRFWILTIRKNNAIRTERVEMPGGVDFGAQRGSRS